MKFILSLSLKVKIIIAACAVAAAAVAVTVIISNSEEAYRVIKVFELNGSAVVTRENTGNIAAYTGMNLESGDVLSVEESSTLRISLDSDKYILLDGGTVLKLIAQGTAADSRTVIELQKGTILNEIKNSLSANSSYEVNTPKATMAVRGTTFTVTTIENPDGSYTTTLYTSEGKVAVQLLDENGAPKGEEVYVPAGGAVTIRTDVNSDTGNPAGVDGDSYFVFPNDDGSFTDCGDSDPVYYPDGRASAEARTEQTAAAVTSDTEASETRDAVTETESTVTAVPFYEAVLPVSDIPTVTTVPPESSEPKPVFPSETAGYAETSAVTTAAAPEAIAEKSQKTEQTTVASSEKTTAAATSAATAAEETRPFYTVTTPPVYTYPPIITPAPAETAPPAPTETAPPAPTETVPTSPTETVPAAPTETEPTETEPTETVPTETVPTETEPTPPTVYKVSFTDENGNVISEAEFDENETLGTLPRIADKKGYTGKWVSGGAEVTENTVISGDMDIKAVYTPMSVTVIIEGPYGTPDGSGTETILTFTVPYDGKLTDNEEGYDLETLSQIAYDHYSDRTSLVYEVKSINILYENYSQASDDTIITGDSVKIDDGVLCCYIVVNFEVEPWWT